MKHMFFAFLIGGVVGVFGAILGGDVARSSEDPEDVVQADGVAAPDDSDPEHQVGVDADADDRALAEALEIARFDGNWPQVSAVARVLREREGGPSSDPDPAPALPTRADPVTERLPDRQVLLDQIYRRRVVLLGLRSRDNPATRLWLDPPADVDRVQRLKDLVVAPEVRQADAQVREDAARVLALLPGEAGIEALGSLLREPSSQHAQTAAEALALSEDPGAVAELEDVLRSDLSPRLRSLAAEALAATRSNAEGERATRALSEVAEGDPDESVRQVAIASLARADLRASQVARNVLRGLIEGETVPLSLRVGSVAALRAHHALSLDLPMEFVEVLHTQVESAPPALRAEVVRALGDVGNAETLELLEAAQLSASGGELAAAYRDALDQLRRRTVR